MPAPRMSGQAVANTMEEEAKRMNLPRLESDRFPVVVDEVSKAIRAAILDGRAPKGTHLVERELAEQLGVSRTPVREALRRLEREGLLVYEPRRGVVVSGFDEQSVRDLYLMRELLEGLAARLAAERHTPDEQAELERLLEEAETAVEQGDVDAAATQNVAITLQLYRMAHSARLEQALAALRDYIESFTRTGYRDDCRLRQAHREHRAIVAAIRDRDADLAEELTRLHVRRSLESWQHRRAVQAAAAAGEGAPTPSDKDT
ncbi:MAG: GntR family transcriptional regulator [Bacillota bacterium]|nr:GntR family transcriptional regulator [Bacillota bacterium]